MTKLIPIFDGHNDALIRLHMSQQDDPVGAFLDGSNNRHLNNKTMEKGGFAGGFFAIFVPSPSGSDQMVRYNEMQKPSYNLPLAHEVSWQEALPEATAMVEIAKELERRGAFKLCLNAAEIKSCIENKVPAVILHMEGAEAIDPSFKSLYDLHEQGLRSLGPVWSRNTLFGTGVPSHFPSSPDIGDGLTELGKKLVKTCNELKLLIDLSHMNEKGFWDIARISDAPLVATHSNAHALAPHPRNLTDKQLAAIKESRGVVGVLFAVAMLREDGQPNANTPLETLLRQFDYLIEHLGEDGVAIGSDFDGALIPNTIGDATGLISLRKAMIDHGYTEELMEKLCNKNWLSVLERTIG